MKGVSGKGLCGPRLDHGRGRRPRHTDDRSGANGGEVSGPGVTRFISEGLMPLATAAQSSVTELAAATARYQEACGD